MQAVPKARRLAELRRPGGHGKSELSSAARCLLHDDLPTVRLHQALDDEQAEARTAAALRAPEPAEDAGRNLGRDARTLVADRYGDARSLRYDRRLHHSRNGTSPVPDGVLDKVRQDLVDLIDVQPGLRQAGSHLDLVPIWGIPGSRPAGGDLQRPARDIDELPVHLDAARLDPGHVQQ